MKKHPRQSEEQVFRPLSWLPQVAKIIDEALEHELEELQTFTEIASEKPWAMDAPLVNRAVQVHREGLDFIEPQRAQLERWLHDPALTEEDQVEINRLLGANERLHEAIHKVLGLLEQIKAETIDAILAKDPGELALEVLSGKRKLPGPAEQGDMLDDFLPGMPLPKLTTPLQRARAALEIQEVVEDVGERDILWLHPDVITAALKTKAIIRATDIYELTDLRERFPGFEQFMLGLSDIALAVEEGKIEIEQPAASGPSAGRAHSRQERGTRAESGRTPRRKVGRNDPCPCGSGRKYKKCCGGGRSQTGGQNHGHDEELSVQYYESLESQFEQREAEGMFEVLRVLELDKDHSEPALVEAVEHFNARNGNVEDGAPLGVFDSHEIEMIYRGGTFRPKLYAILLSGKFADALENRSAFVRHAYKYGFHEDT